ncbi:MAG: tetratricopeptide repeat protein [Planctomycetota bacterium]
MKALEKDRNRRYETASSFAKDVERFLNDEPVDARPPSTSYRVRKFVRRNKSTVVAGALILLAFLIGVVGLAVGLDRARRFAVILDQKLLEVEAMNERIRGLLIDRAFATAMSGDFNGTEQSVKDMQQAGVPEHFIEMLRGQVALYGSDVDEAIRHLKRAVELKEDCVAARAMLSAAYDFAGHYYTASDGRVDLEEYTPVTAEDHLFMAQAMRLYPDKALESADRAKSLRNTPLAHAVRAEIVAHQALKTGDCKTAMSAVSEIEGALKFMRDNPLALSIDLFVHHVALRVSSKIGEPSAELRGRADEIAMQLERFPDYKIACGTRASYYDYVGDEEAAEEALEIAVAGSIPNWYMTSYLALLYRRGKCDLAMTLLERDPSRKRPRAIHAFILAETAEGREELQSLYDEWDAGDKWASGFHLGVLLIPFVLGDSKTGKQISGECLQRLDFESTFGIHAKGARELTEILAGKKSTEDLMERGDSARGALQWAHYLTGLMDLADGRRIAAKDNFDKCVNAGSFLIDFHTSKALSDRIEQCRDWPNWIPAEDEGGRQ